MTYRLGVLDPSIDTDNAGDQIILDAITSELRALLPDVELLHLPTQRRMTSQELALAGSCDKFVVAGTNLISSNMHRYRQWCIGMPEIRALREKVVLLGVGWWKYQGPPNFFTRHLLRRLLATGPHSMRDAWSKSQLGHAGFQSYNTGCPTMWRLPANPESDSRPSHRVLVTFTDYKRAPIADRRLLTFLSQQYDSVLLWPQGDRDRTYMRLLAPKAQILPSGVAVLNSYLRSGDIDYVGTRLHAGIRALQLGVRSTVIAVDNRALEIARDTGLPICTRKLTQSDIEFLGGERQVSLTIPTEGRDTWLREFAEWLTA